MKKRLLVLPFVALVIAGGCSSGSSSSPAASTAVPRGKPAHLRLVNLSGKTALGSVRGLYKDWAVQPFEMTSAQPLSPGRSFHISVKLDGRELNTDIKTEGGKFSTIVIKPSSIESFNSGESISQPGGAKIDFVNLTDRPIDFLVGKEPINVKSGSSISKEYPVDKVKVSAKSASEIEIQLGISQFWSAFAIMQNGKLMIKSANLKGTGVAVGTGPSAS